MVRATRWWSCVAAVGLCDFARTIFAKVAQLDGGAVNVFRLHLSLIECCAALFGLGLGA